MKVVFQFNDKVLTYGNFQEKDIPEVERVFGKNTFDKEQFYEYVEVMKRWNQKRGSMKQSKFPPSMEIYLD